MSNARTLANTINSNSEIVVPSGGIQFADATNANTVANQSNLIEQDGYEEGTWTPTINLGGSSLTASNAFYTKIGRIVFISFALTNISSPVASRLQIEGLPFTQGASLDLQGMYVTYDDTGAPADTVILISSSILYFTRQGTGTNVNGNSFNFSGQRQIRLSGSYLTAS